MLFNTISFLFLFLPIVLILYYTVDKFNFRYKNNVINFLLVVFSLYFYFWKGTRTLLAPFIIIVVWNYLTALLSEKWRPALLVGVVGNIGIFFYYKIFHTLANVIANLFAFNVSISSILIPVGLSFILFHCISYLLDIYHRKAKPNHNLIEFILYVSFFPKLMQGPLVKYHEFEPQLRDRVVNFDMLISGIERFIIGLGKKVLLADIFGRLLWEISFRTNYVVDIPTAWLGCILFTIQIYLDFSAYSDMAIGLGKMFGFKFLENFNFPYSSLSISEFWRRWHITLGAWFREYVYIPLGGNRKGNVYINLLIVFILTGIWHGTGVTFLLWGFGHGLCVVVERFLNKRGWYEKIPKIFRWLYTMFVVSMGWLCFMMPQADKLKNYIDRMFGKGIDMEQINFFVPYFVTRHLVFLTGVTIVGLIVLNNDRIRSFLLQKSKETFLGTAIKYVLLLAIFVFSICGIIHGTHRPFLYFQF